ncbi:MAG TPA: alpha/beta fold hydrolase [Longimicrobiales bacterium]|nr:alpha/beta fold hydrolase [Longimicrobiales bacterium]
MNELDGALARLLELSGCRPTRRWIDLAARLHLLEHGTGAPLLLLHGGGGGAGNWYRLLAPLGRHARVLAPDFPGFGHSDELPLSLPLGMQAAHLLVQLLDALEIARASVLGTSFGGLAALRLARHFPDRVERLVLLDSAGLAAAAPALLWWATRPLIDRWALRPSRAGTRQVLRRLLTSSPLPAEHEDALTDYLSASARAHRQSAPAALRAFLSGREQREWLDARELAGIAAPVLLLWGERDRFFPVAQARAAARVLPRGQLRVLPGAGHSPNWERPELVLRELEWFLFDEVGGDDAEHAQEDPG